MDRDLAGKLARYSALAYEPPGAVKSALPDADITFHDHDSTQAYVIEDASCTVVAIRGTQIFSGLSFADVLSNLWIRRRSWGPGKVHRGYREAVLDILQDIKQPLFARNRPLYYTGHSLGGALATLASTVPPSPTATYTFGAPRVGDTEFAASLTDLFRIVHGNDIAPRYPLPIGYRHGGAVWHLSRAGVLSPGLPNGWHLRFPLSAKALAKAILDHRAGEYVKKLGLRGFSA